MSTVNKQSGIELLRIAAMLFVLVQHANMFTLGRPDGYSMVALAAYAVESVTIIGVNCFALVSGYFGMRFSMMKVANLVFMCCFCVLPIAIVLYACGEVQISGMSSLIENFWPLNYWYIVAYIGLLIVVPVLNRALDGMSTRSLRNLLLLFYGYVMVFDAGLRDEAAGVLGGYTLVWLVFLYMLGRLLYRYKDREVKTSRLVAVFAVCVAVKTVLAFLHINGYRYSNPTILVASVCFFMMFARMRFSSRAVNAIGASATMVYLLNLQPQVLGYFRRVVIYLFTNYTLVTFCVLVAAFCVAFFFVAVAYDKLRIAAWKPVARWLAPITKKIDDRL